MFISGTGPVGVEDATFLSSSDSNIMNDIYNPDVHSNFQEFSVWNYFDFQLEDMGYTCVCINMKKSPVCQTIDYLQMPMNIRNYWSPSEAHDSLLKYFMGVCVICDCIFSTK
jgi:hypothetical protein